MNVVDLTGINLFAHAQNLIINVDNITFNVPEPASAAPARHRDGLPRPVPSSTDLIEPCI